MPEQFLYEQLDAVSSPGFLKKEIPDSVAQNLNPKYELRPYQREAFARFFHCHQNDFPDKTYPLHLLFNMATGSGKTLILAGLTFSRRVRVSPVENFEGVNPGGINICFTTIQKLHSDLTSEKENALTFDDFRKRKVAHLPTLRRAKGKTPQRA